MAKKRGSENLKKLYFSALDKHEDVTHVSYIHVCQGLFKMQFCSFSQNKVMGYLRFFKHGSDFLPFCNLTYAKKNTKIP